MGSVRRTAAGTYCVVVSFAGSTDYVAAQSAPAVFTIAQAPPAVSAADAGGTYNGLAFPATATIAGVGVGVDTVPAADLEGVGPMFTYYAGADTGGTNLGSTAPTVAGTYCVVASFPGSADYAPAQSPAVTFVVAEATPTVNAADAGGTYNGSAFPATATLAGVVVGVDTVPAASLEGVAPTFTYYAGTDDDGTNLGNTVPTTAGTYSVVASFAGSADYAAAQSSAVPFTIAKASPTITWVAPSPIIYGTALDDTQLDATADVPGSFAYAPAAGTVLDAGSQTLSATFTPADTTDYSTATASIGLTVNQTLLTLTTESQAKTYGQVLTFNRLQRHGHRPAERRRDHNRGLLQYWGRGGCDGVGRPVHGHGRARGSGPKVGELRSDGEQREPDGEQGPANRNGRQRRQDLRAGHPDTHGQFERVRQR